jgi:hypothetical protein
METINDYETLNAIHHDAPAIMMRPRALRCEIYGMAVCDKRGAVRNGAIPGRREHGPPVDGRQRRRDGLGLAEAGDKALCRNATAIARARSSAGRATDFKLVLGCHTLHHRASP